MKIKSVLSMIFVTVVVSLVFIGFDTVDSVNASANGIPSWIRGTWHNKHYYFKFTYKNVFVKNTKTNKQRHYKVYSFGDTPDVNYIETSKGIKHGFAVEGFNKGISVMRYNSFPNLGNHWISLKK